MIVHYIDTHRYAPPPAFVAAVRACPLPSEPTYDDAILRFAAVWSMKEKELARHLERRRSRLCLAVTHSTADQAITLVPRANASSVMSE